MNINNVTNHPLQSFEWGEFRKKTGVKVIRENDLQLTIHKIPYTPWAIGYLPKSPMPDKKMIEELEKIGREENCIYIQIEPNAPRFTSEEPVPVTSEVTRQRPRLLRGGSFKMFGLRPSFHPLFTKYTFILDITKSENELLKAMHPKTRYNIKVAQKHGVKIIEDNSDEAFETYLKLTRETTKRQGFYAHSEQYHKTMWEALKAPNGHQLYSSSERGESRSSNVKSSRLRPAERDSARTINTNSLTAHLLIARYQGKILVTWILFVYNDTLYYPYGASSSEHRETMASNLMMWETIRFGKKLGLKKFDMWGCLGPNPDKNDPWYGFHRFKEGYGGELVEFVGSYDLVINPILYQFYKIADKMRWIILKLKTSVQ